MERVSFPTLSNQAQGALFKVSAGACFALNNVLFRYIDLPACQIACLQYGLGSLLVWLLAKERGTFFEHPHRCLFALQGVISALGVVFFICSVKALPLIQTVMLSFLGPILTTLGARLILKERLTRYRILAIILASVGGVILACMRTLPKGGTWWTILLPIAAATCFSSENIIAKTLLNKNNSPRKVSLYLMLSISLFLLPTSLFRFLFPELFSEIPLIEKALLWTIPSAQDVFFLMCLCATTAGASLLLNRAYAVTDVSFLLPFGSLRPILSILLGWLLFAELPAPLSLAGAGAILLAIFIVKREKL